MLLPLIPANIRQPWYISFLANVDMNYMFSEVISCISVMCTNNRVNYGLMVLFICFTLHYLIYHHYADISEGIKLLKCLYILSSLYLRLNQFSQSSFMQLIVMYIFSLPRSEIWPIWHCLGLGYEKMVCNVCRSVFLSRLINITAHII